MYPRGLQLPGSLCSYKSSPWFQDVKFVIRIWKSTCQGLPGLKQSDATVKLLVSS